MPRRVRIDTPNYYHIINRGVEKRIVFLEKQDKDYFLNILNKEFLIYKVILHSYVLMDNHYHLLIETTKNNLSDVMRQLNSKYAIYFNKKYNRVGHLWQDRFKSWVVLNENYLYTLFKYIELNPIKVNLVSRFGTYYRSFLYDVINNKILEVSKESFLMKYSLKEIFLILDIELNDKDLENLDRIKSENRGMKKELLNLNKNRDIKEEFSKEFKNKKERNTMIINAYKKGFKQKDIANFLNLTPSLISKIITQNQGSK